MELNVLHLKSCEIQWNRCAQAILPFIAFLRINSLLLVCRPLYQLINFSVYFSLPFVVAVFLFRVPKVSETSVKDSREGRSLSRARAFPRSENTQKIMSVQRWLLFLIYCWSGELLNCDLTTTSILLVLFWDNSDSKALCKEVKYWYPSTAVS